jgi:dTDP-4-amino-4,6-dideoxygalactose transaminase
MKLAEKYNLFVIEDAAQSIDSYYNGKPLGSFGHLSTFSFHETKNIISGEGGMLVINDPQFNRRSEIIWEKGTNRSEFFRGEINKYGWVDIGSSFLPSEIIAAFLYAQLEKTEEIQNRRKYLWNNYYNELLPLEKNGKIRLPKIPDYSTNNAHMFYIVCNNLQNRDDLIQHLKKNDILSVFHYLSLHKSPYFTGKHDGRLLSMSDYYSDCLLRLPLFFELTDDSQLYIIKKIRDFFSV